VTGLRIDPHPCRRYDWPPSEACWRVYSGAHVCGLPAGHAGTCVCAECGVRAEDWQTCRRKRSARGMAPSTTNG
jgi:hypothetical protein